MSYRDSIKRILAFFAVFSFIEYLAFHGLYLLTDGLSEYVLLPIRISVSVVPVMAAAAVIREGLGLGGTMRHLGYIALVRLPFSFLYSYMFTVLYYRTVLGEALLWSILFSLAITLVYYAAFCAVYGLVRLSFRLSGAEYITVDRFPLRISNLSCPLVRGLAILPFVIFLVELVLEIITTVSYFIDVGSGYRTSEVVYMVFQYVLIIGIFVAAMLLAAMLTNRFMKEKVEEE